MISLSGIGKVFFDKLNWVRNQIDNHLEIILWVFLVPFLAMIGWIIYNYATCYPPCNCKYNDLFDLSMAITSVLGGGLISAMGALYERFKTNIGDKINKDDVLRVKLFRQNEQILKFLDELRKERLPQTSSEESIEFTDTSDIFVDAYVGDSKLADKIVICLESNSLSCLAPIPFQGGKIDILAALRDRIKSCKHVVVVCGNTDYGAWVDTRLKLYDKLKQELSIFPKIFVFHTDDVQFDQERNPVKFINCPKDQEVIQCNQLVSLIKEKTGKSS